MTGYCPSLAGMQSMHERERQHVTERQEGVQEHGRSWTPSKASGSYRSRTGGGLKSDKGSDGANRTEDTDGGVG